MYWAVRLGGSLVSADLLLTAVLRLLAFDAYSVSRMPVMKVARGDC